MNRKWYQKEEKLLNDIRTSQPKADEIYAWYIGQCGYVLKKNAVIYIDPVLNDLADDNGETVRYYEEPFKPAQAEADYVFCTHAHADHCAIETVSGIAKANPATKFIVPADCIPGMTEAGIARNRIIEAKAGHELRLPVSEAQGSSCAGTDITVLPVAAAHPTHAKTADGGDVALSYLIGFPVCGPGTEAGDLNPAGRFYVLHMGDTYLTDQLYGDLKALPAPDLFFPPINGGDYFRTARNCIGNLSAIESARLAVELKAAVTIPTHYDMVKDNTVDPLDFVRELRKLDTAARWVLPALGERVTLRKQ